MKTSMNYPTKEESLAILERFGQSDPLDTLRPVVDATDVAEAISSVSSVFVHTDVAQYIVNIVEATRNSENVELGASPRGAIALQKAAKAFAAMDGRDYATPDDVKRAAVPVLAHRIIMSSNARIRRGSAEEAVEQILSTVAVPTEAAIFRARR